MQDGLVVITGGGSGIGRLLAVHFSERFSVLICGRRGEALQATCAQCKLGSCTSIAADIGSRAGREALTQATYGRPIKYLIHNAAVGDPVELQAVSSDAWEEAFAVNVTAPMFLTQAMLPQLEAATGRVLHLGTSVSFRPQLGTGLYGITKLAFHRSFEQWNADLRSAGSCVRVGSLSPGLVDTEGVRAHVTKARARALPHVKWFDAAFESGAVTDPARLCEMVSHVLEYTDDNDFADEEWRYRKWVESSSDFGAGVQPTSPMLAGPCAPTHQLLRGIVLGFVLGATTVCVWRRR